METMKGWSDFPESDFDSAFILMSVFRTKLDSAFFYRKLSLDSKDHVNCCNATKMKPTVVGITLVVRLFLIYILVQCVCISRAHICW